MIDVKELKKRIQMAGYTQKEMYKKIGIPYSTGCSYLNEINPIPDHFIDKLEAVLKEKQNSQTREP
jgi:hypothetical protein